MALLFRLKYNLKVTNRIYNKISNSLIQIKYKGTFKRFQKLIIFTQAQYIKKVIWMKMKICLKIIQFLINGLIKMKLQSQIRKITNKIHRKMKKLKRVRLGKIPNSVISRLLKV